MPKTNVTNQGVENLTDFQTALAALEASMRHEEEPEAIIDGLLRGTAEFYGADRAYVIEADWDLAIGLNTYEWCAAHAESQRDDMQFLNMEIFPRWKRHLEKSEPVIIENVEDLKEENPAEYAFFTKCEVQTLIATPFSKQLNQGYIGVDNPTRFGTDPAFLFIVAYAIVCELNEIKLLQAKDAASRASKYNPTDVYVNGFAGLEIINSGGTLTGDQIKADQSYTLLAYLFLNHNKTLPIENLAEVVCQYDASDNPYRAVKNVVYRTKRILSVIGLDTLIIGRGGTFILNPEYNIYTDFDRFEDACLRLKNEQNPERRSALYHGAVELYKGLLFPRINELWLIQQAMYYQSLFLQVIKGYIRTKMEIKDYILVQKAATEGLNIDPYDSELNTYVIISMCAQGNVSMAKTFLNTAQEHMSLAQIETAKKFIQKKSMCSCDEANAEP